MRKLFFLLFLISTSLSATNQHYLSICTIFRDEARFLKEWIEYHRMMGVEHFYLYNHMSVDHYYDVLRPYVEEGIIDLFEWPYPPKNQTDWIQNIQGGAYNKTLKEKGDENVWIAFIDSDEFLVLPNGDTLPEFLSDYEDFGGLTVHWQVFGTSSVQRIPEDKTMIGTLTRKARPHHWRNTWIKSIVQPKCVKKFIRVHCPEYKKSFFAVNENKKKSPSSSQISPISIDLIRLHHYIDRDKDFYTNIKVPRIRKRKTLPPKPNPEYNECEDLFMLQYVPELERRLFYDPSPVPVSLPD